MRMMYIEYPFLSETLSPCIGLEVRTRSWSGEVDEDLGSSRHEATDDQALGRALLDLHNQRLCASDGVPEETRTSWAKVVSSVRSLTSTGFLNIAFLSMDGLHYGTCFCREENP